MAQLKIDTSIMQIAQNALRTTNVNIDDGLNSVLNSVNRIKNSNCAASEKFIESVGVFRTKYVPARNESLRSFADFIQTVIHDSTVMIETNIIKTDSLSDSFK